MQPPAHPTGPVPVVNGLTTMEPLYTPQNTKPAYQLNWGLTIFWRQSPIDEGNWLADLQEATEPDGVRVIKHRIASSVLP